MATRLKIPTTDKMSHRTALERRHGSDTSTDTLSWLSGRDLGKDSGCLSDAVPSESPTGPSQSRLNPSYLLLNIFTRTLHSSGGGPVFVGIIGFI